MSSFERNSFPRKRGTFPRKSDRELESFLPETMKNPKVFSGHSKSHGYHKPLYSHVSDETDQKLYCESAKKFSGKQNKENRRNGYSYEDYSGASTEEGDFSTRKIHNAWESEARRSPQPVFMGAKKIMNPMMKISSETFQTAALDTLPAMPSYMESQRSSPKIVLNRNMKMEEDKEPAKIQILKPNSESTQSSPSSVPVILSRSKPLPEKEFKQPHLLGIEKKSAEREVLRRGAPLTIYDKGLKPSVFSDLENKVVPSKEMRQPFRLIDLDFKLCEGHTAFNAYLLEQTNFLVVGVIGRQGVGKSTIASLLLQTKLNPPAGSDRGFRVSGRSELLKGSHCTGGLDVLVTPQRLIVLDFPALLAPGAMDTTVGTSDSRIPLEMLVQTRSLQFMALALRVCHVVVVVQDSREQGTELLKCLQAAAVVNRSDEATGTHTIRSTPDLCGESKPLVSSTVMVVCNKMSSAPPSLQALTFIERHVSRHLRPGLLNMSSGVGEAPRGTVNLFTLPFIRNCAKERNSLSPSMQTLRSAIMGLERRSFPGYDSPPTERAWFEYTVRQWEKILKSSLYLDYSRLFP
ncbi:nonsense-mediated mRNA decay factor SMG9 [Hyalella azteca]|uniref:Nonsense-mediated mRNA decay factor SMG9 n=1 Tax=Hyalella azteca TaxID=294128 RepID=A0A8B7N2G4_HYAAZ|nr:nonsense-mediated mRNA decay factor SMG9 [Hyalella azteca]